MYTLNAMQVILGKSVYAKHIQEKNSTGNAFGIAIQCIIFKFKFGGLLDINSVLYLKNNDYFQ